MEITEYRDSISENWWSGHVYVIKCNSYYKIGYSKRNPKYRMSNMQTGNPHKLKLVKSFFCRNAGDQETILHQFFEDKNVRGEWFKLNKEDVAIIDEIITIV